MNNIITQAQYRIRSFSKVNNIELNEEMFEVPLESAREYAQNMGYTLEDVLEDLGGREAMFVDFFPFALKRVIVYDESKFNTGDEDEEIQIIIHEYLHFNEASDDEAEDEVLSIIIAFESDKPFDEGLKSARSKLSLEKLKAMYVQDPELPFNMDRKLDTLTLREARRWLE